MTELARIGSTGTHHRHPGTGGQEGRRLAEEHCQQDQTCPGHLCLEYQNIEDYRLWDHMRIIMRIFLLNENFQLVVQFFSPALENLLSLDETVIVLYEAESDEVLADTLVLLAEEGGGRNSLKLPVLAQPFGKPGREYQNLLSDSFSVVPVISCGVSFRAEVDLVRQTTPVGHHEVAALRYDGLHPHLRQDLGQEIPLPLQVNRDRLEVAVVLAQPAHLLLEAPGDRLLDGSGASILEISDQ